MQPPHEVRGYKEPGRRVSSAAVRFSHRHEVHALPISGGRQAIDNLDDAAPCCRRRCLGEGIRREEAYLGDLAIGVRRRFRGESTGDEDRDMVPRAEMCVEEQPVQLWRRSETDCRFLDKLAAHRFLGGLAGIDPASRQLPPGHISVAHQQDMPLCIDHRGAHAERDAPRQPAP